MATDSCPNVRAVLVGDYDEVNTIAGSLRDSSSPAKCLVDRPRLVLECVENGISAEELRQFKVLLRDKREVTVCGHSLEHVPGKESPEDPALYRVVMRSGDRDVLVALFRASEVTGIFCGDLREARESA